MDVKRSGHRARQAEATKRTIAEAARRLFDRNGYAATTIRAISDEAGIPEQTIYSALGNKARILEKVTELWMLDSRTLDRARAYFDEPDPAQRLRMFASLNAGQLETGADVLRIHREAARSDPAMDEVLSRMLAARESEIRMLLISIQEALSTSVEEALDITLAVTLDAVYLALLDRGWSASRYEEWLARTLVTQLLR